MEAAAKHTRAIVRLLARMITKGDDKAFEEIIKWAYAPEPGKATEIDDSVVETQKEIEKDALYIYKLYPTVDSCGRALQKGTKDKKTIVRLLANGETKESLEKKVKEYIEDCEKNNRYMKNLATWLNNIPINEKEEAIDLIPLDQDY